MPPSRHGRAARLRVSAGLTVCLACATLAAGPPDVRPDKAAGLAPVAAVSFDEPAAEIAERSGFEPWLLGRGTPLGGPFKGATGGSSASVERRATLALADEPPVAPIREDAEQEPSFRPGSWSVDGSEVFNSPDAAEPFRYRAADSASFFDPTADLPPVVRGQSPEISLLPLSEGDAQIENTSLLRWATGTKGRLRADYLTDFGGTDRIGVQALTQGWFGIGWDGSANYWQRPIAGQDHVPLWTGDLNVIYNFPFHPRYKFRSGAGAAWRVDRGHVEAGYNVTHGLDVYLLWRAMATGEINWGMIDDDKLFRYRLALGLTYESFEFFSGYESYKLGSERLDGWVNGVAFWY